MSIFIVECKGAHPNLVLKSRNDKKGAVAMDCFDWQSFLERWNSVVFGSDELPETLSQDVIKRRWLGYPGATEQQIVYLEARLGTRLPPSYCAFLKVSNGWHLADDIIDKLWSTDEIAWFAVRHQDWIDAWVRGIDDLPSVRDEDYFVYGGAQDTIKMRRQYLQTALEISTNEPDMSAIFLLNPQVVTSGGEWEAWFFANWIAGATRYRSFQEMMQAQYEALVHERDDRENGK